MSTTVTQPPSASVFTKFEPQSAPSPALNAAKYGSGDTPKSYPVFALWMMLVTEDWDNAFAEPAFSHQLFDELIAEHFKANPPADQAEMLKTQAALQQQLSILLARAQESGADIARVRNVWQNLLKFDTPADFYGGRPCPGGGSILNFANIKNQPRP